ncbi:MAG: hypothetical protein M3Z02_01610 [Actinomycetota bacterium]|nr:hypothetical protein [Actinomycetota bacterium]
MKVLITVLYTFLLGWGFSVGARQIYQGFRRPNELLNPLFSNRVAIRLFTLHIIVVSADLFVIGPWAVTHKSTLWYWGGRIALLSSSLPIAAYMNRNPQSFGKFIGRWVTFRNLFEYTSHVVVAAMAVNWFYYYILLWWLVAYRYLDVGPRRALQKLYNTPEKKAARPWAPGLNWAVIASIYVLAFLAIYNRQVLYAKVPGDNVVPHVPASWEVAVVVGFNLALALGVWIGIRKYTDSLTSRSQPAETAAVGSH